MTATRKIMAAITMLCASSVKSAESTHPNTPDEIRNVQIVLFELGYSSGGDYPDGKMGPKTRESIKDYQRQNKKPESGVFTKAEYKEFIERALPVRIRGAISVSTEGDFHAVWNYPSAMSAYDDARAKCMSMATSCVTLASSRWIVALSCEKKDLVVRNGKEYTRIRNYANVQPSENEADALNLAYKKAEANEPSYLPRDCKVVSAIAANGAHKK